MCSVPFTNLAMASTVSWGGATIYMLLKEAKTVNVFGAGWILPMSVQGSNRRTPNIIGKPLQLEWEIPNRWTHSGYLYDAIWWNSFWFFCFFFAVTTRILRIYGPVLVTSCVLACCVSWISGFSHFLRWTTSFENNLMSKSTSMSKGIGKKSNKINEQKHG